MIAILACAQALAQPALIRLPDGGVVPDVSVGVMTFVSYGARGDAFAAEVAGGKLGMVETVTKSDGLTLYEAAYTTKAGKKGAILVKADCTETKD